MIAFEPSKLLHGSRVPDEVGQDCQRIGLALSQHTIAVKVAKAAFDACKHKVARQQQQQIAKVDEMRARKKLKLSS